MKAKRKKLQTIVQGICLIEKLSPGFMLCCMAQAVLKALQPFINIFLSAMMVNSLLAGQNMSYLLCLMVWMVTMNLVCGGLVSIMDRFVGVKQNILFAQYDWNMNKKMMDLPYADIESYAVQKQREKIRQMQQVNGMGLWKLVLSIKTATQSIFSILYAVAAFYSVFFYQGGRDGSTLIGFFCSPWASVLLAVLVVGNIIVSLWTVSQSTKKVFVGYADLVPINQVFTYYMENYIDTYHSGKDIRLYRQGNLIRKEMNHLVENGKISLKKLKGITFKYDSFGALASFVMNLFIYLTVGLRALAGVFPVGNIVQYIGGISQFITGVTTLAGQLTLLFSNVEALDLVLQYLGRSSSGEQKDTIHRRWTFAAEQEGQEVGEGKVLRIDPLMPLEIEFRNVSFTYPDTDCKVLEHLSFTFHAGEKLAVVGANGSGKTTMIKLLCRLYDVDEGEILLNGVNIREFNTKDYQELFGVVFQDFQLFSFGLGQNLAGNVNYDKEKVKAALEEADFGARLENMGPDTPLYKDFDAQGVEISGGEAQKIAIARALYKQAAILVLDEPTAALDPQAEYEVYKNLNHISENKTTIFISHRMSSCRFCDRILVFDQGRLVQEGGHEELLGDREGKYYQLWRAQEQYYI